MESAFIRQRFLDFFKARGHTIVPSSSLIPDDPSACPPKFLAVA